MQRYGVRSADVLQCYSSEEQNIKCHLEVSQMGFSGTWSEGEPAAAVLADAVFTCLRCSSCLQCTWLLKIDVLKIAPFCPLPQFHIAVVSRNAENEFILCISYNTELQDVTAVKRACKRCTPPKAVAQRWLLHLAGFRSIWVFHIFDSQQLFLLRYFLFFCFYNCSCASL